MSFREHVEKLENLNKIQKPVSKKLEASAIINELVDKPVLFEKIKESEFKVAGNIFPTKQTIADYLGCKVSELIPTITKAIENPTKPEVIENAPCQEEEMQ